jgi:hypothetical protein
MHRKTNTLIHSVLIFPCGNLFQTGAQIMTEVHAPIVASWEAPPWAETSERDDEAVIHSRPVGCLLDLDGGALGVELVQRDEMVFASSDTSVQRTPPYIRVAGQRVDVEDAALLSQFLGAASDLASGAPTASAEAGSPG